LVSSGQEAGQGGVNESIPLSLALK